MLEQLDKETRKDIRILGNIINNNYKYSRVEDRDNAIDMLMYRISDKVITLLLNEDKERKEYFLSNK